MDVNVVTRTSRVITIELTEDEYRNLENALNYVEKNDLAVEEAQALNELYWAM